MYPRPKFRSSGPDEYPFWFPLTFQHGSPLNSTVSAHSTPTNMETDQKPMLSFAFWILTVMLLGAAAGASAFEVNAKKYFAYYKIPDKRSGGLSIFSPYVLLSREKCQAKGVGKQFDARKAMSFWPNSQQTRHECWTTLPDETLLICPVGEKEDGDIGNACVEISKSRFADTSALPKSAKF